MHGANGQPKSQQECTCHQGKVIGHGKSERLNEKSLVREADAERIVDFRDHGAQRRALLDASE